MRRFDRRDLFRYAAATGALLAGRPARALPPSEGGLHSSAKPPFFMFFHASGGWDTTLLCDPKGAHSGAEAAPINPYSAGDIETAGNIRYAPSAANRSFFQKHHQRALIINGIDVATINHVLGVRHIWSGSRAADYPSIGALISAATASEMPLSHIMFGGLNATAGLIPKTRFDNLDAVEQVAWPHRIGGDEAETTFHSQGTLDRIAAAQQKRRQFLAGERFLPRGQRGLEQLYTARAAGPGIRRLRDYMPSGSTANALQRQVILAMVSFRAGLAKTANLHVPGFDTHVNHDTTHPERLETLLAGVDFALQEADRLGIAEHLVIVVGSELGRSPRYNKDAGKDHWNVGSMMFFGPGIAGNRVLGGTTDEQAARQISPETLQVVESGGITLQPRHIHAALRQLAGIQGDSLCADRFPLADTPVLPLFSGV